MAKLREIFNFDNPKYAPLREPSRAVIKAYQDANRYFDTTQEYVYIEQGMVFLSKIIHSQAHEFPKRFDAFVEMLHERHLMGEYPATDELDWRSELENIDDVFELLIRVLDNIHDALESFRKVTDNAEFRPMALYAEELMLENSRTYTKFLMLWARWDENAGSKTSFDSWCQKIIDNTEENDG